MCVCVYGKIQFGFIGRERFERIQRWRQKFRLLSQELHRWNVVERHQLQAIQRGTEGAAREAEDHDPDHGRWFQRGLFERGHLQSCSNPAPYRVERSAPDF